MLKTSAELIEYSEGPEGQRMASFIFTFPRYILPEVNTHAIASKSASSSRAIPTPRYVDNILENPALPNTWRKNQSGMQPAGYLDEETSRKADDIWNRAALAAIGFAQELRELGVAKEQANRVIEGYTFTRQIFTATSFGNFFNLRTHSTTQEEFRELATLAQQELANAIPIRLDYGEWHAPFVRSHEREHLRMTGFEDLIPIISAARCARVSYNKHDGSKPKIADDVRLFEQLAISKPAHMSPCAHQGLPMRNPSLRSRNFVGFKQFREILEVDGWGKYDPVGVIDSFM